ncbi:MAG: hypothetical protein E7359_03880 [Clostridiales bacterium]|nr:hypothetical protein [Clostridiales bacterium]
MITEAEKRLNQALILEKHFNPKKIRSVIKSDIFSLLKNYGDIESEGLHFDIVILDDGSYEVEFKAKLNHLKMFKSFN